MSVDLREKARRWIEGDPDPQTAAELRALIERDDDEAEGELVESMTGPLSFGTAGLRGIIGAGDNRMNRAVIRRTTAGLVAYLLETIPEARRQGVAIGFDGRHFSQIFAADAAGVVSGAGVKAYLFPEMVPTPLLAYAVKELGAAAGVMITASHNPPQYNGYKVYWDNGAQIIPPHDRGIADAIDQIGEARSVPLMRGGEAEQRGLLTLLGEDIRERYLASVAALSIDPGGRDQVSIVYTPMHGVGDPFTREALRRFGFDKVWSVPEQREADPDFPTVNFPNPEEPGALDLTLALAREKKANLVLANDPDADRLAVATPLPGKTGEFRQLNGNEIGVLLGEYLVRRRAEGGDQRLLVTTIVSSPMLGEIARREGLLFRETLTGFKWIFTAAAEMKRDHGASFLFGYEEALGYASGDLVRDKDGVSAAAIFAELTAVAAAEGRTITDELERLARTYGLYASRQVSLVRQGIEGKAEIKKMMDSLRRDPPQRVANHAVQIVRDVLSGTSKAGGVTRALSLPSSDVMAFDLDGGARIIARPSGTEPKLKLYFDLREELDETVDFETNRQRVGQELERLAEAFLELLT